MRGGGPGTPDGNDGRPIRFDATFPLGRPAARTFEGKGAGAAPANGCFELCGGGHATRAARASAEHPPRWLRVAPQPRPVASLDHLEKRQQEAANQLKRVEARKALQVKGGEEQTKEMTNAEREVLDEQQVLDFYRTSWVAECTLVHDNGEILKPYLDQIQLLRQSHLQVLFRLTSRRRRERATTRVSTKLPAVHQAQTNPPTTTP